LKYSFPIKTKDYPDDIFCIYAATNNSEYHLKSDDISIINQSRTIEILLSNIEVELDKYGFSASRTASGFEWHTFNSMNSLETSCLIPLIKEMYIKDSSGEYTIFFDSECLSQRELGIFEEALNKGGIISADCGDGWVPVNLKIGSH
jgi:hypothetical protein